MIAVQAYNINQMLSFITECFESYYIRKLLSFAHNRVDRYISLKYQGMKSAGICVDHIQKLENENTFLVNSQSQRGVKYLVDMNLGVCSCIGGQDGSPCSHQAAIAKLFGIYSVNCVSTISSTARQQLAVVALGNNAIQEGDFYTSLHQQQEEKRLGVQADCVHDDAEDLDLLNAITAAHDRIASTDENDMTSEGNDQITTSIAQDDILQQLKEFSEDITERIKSTPIVADAMKTFLRRYKLLTKQGGFVNARLSSALHRFGWVFGGTVSRKDHNGRFRRGRRIPINAKAAGHHRGTTTRGKAVMLQGRPKGIKMATFPKSITSLNIKKRPPKRPHSLSENVARGVQNAGRW